MNRLWRLWIIACGLVLATCKGTGLVGGECREPLLECGGICVNIATDEENCGSCGKTCRRSETCRLGLCLDSDTIPSATLTSDPDGGPLADGGSSLDPDANMSVPSASVSTTAPTSSTSGDASVDPCIPPYNTAERCGACDVACGPSKPYCGDLGNGYECLSGCPPDRELCEDRCADTTQDEWNCGRCGNVCPTGICRDSKCVGGHAGHLVVICTSYEQVFESSPQTTLLGNALFLSTMDVTRVLLLENYANAAAKSGLRKALGWAESTHLGTVQLTAVSSPDQVVARLNARDFDVFLIADPIGAPSGALAAMGLQLSTTIDTFIRAGGTAIITNGSGTPTIGDFLGSNGTSLLDVRGVGDVTFTELNNRAPADGLAVKVLSPFLALSTSCVYDTDVGNGPDTNVVITGTLDGETEERPVVFHRVYLP